MIEFSDYTYDQLQNKSRERVDNYQRTLEALYRQVKETKDNLDREVNRTLFIESILAKRERNNLQSIDLVPQKIVDSYNHELH